MRPFGEKLRSVTVEKMIARIKRGGVTLIAVNLKTPERLCECAYSVYRSRCEKGPGVSLPFSLVVNPPKFVPKAWQQ